MNDIDTLLTNHLDLWVSAITRKSTAGRGRSNTLRLYGLDRLRKLILDLAQLGRLVPQDPADEHASLAVQRAEASATRRLKQAADLRKSNAGSAKASTKPPGWVSASISEIADVQAGFAFKSNGFNEVGTGLPLIRIRDVGHTFTGTYYSGEYRDEFVVRDGDYLISMDGEFRISKWTGPDALLNQRVARLIFKNEEIEKQFVAIALQGQLSKLQGVKAYTTVDHLSGRQIAEARIDLPPIAEQRRIVARLEELMALCDRLEAMTCKGFEDHQLLVKELLRTVIASRNTSELAENWSRIEANFDDIFVTENSVDQLRQAILQLAGMGRLVRQDSMDEPASALLTRITTLWKDQMTERGIRGAKAPSLSARDIESCAYPESWSLAPLGQLAIIIDPNPSHRYPEYTGGTVPLLSTQEFSGENGWNHLGAKLTTEAFWQFQQEICAFAEGDIIFARKGRLGLPRFLPVIDRYTFSHTLFLVKPMSGVDPNYLLWILRRKQTVEWLTNEMNQNTGVPTLGKAKMERLPIPLPPLSEQRRIVARVERLMDLCDSLRSQLVNINDNTACIADAIVTEAVR